MIVVEDIVIIMSPGWHLALARTCGDGTLRQVIRCVDLPTDLRKSSREFKQRHIVFVGDSTMRNIFHVFSRAIGEENAGSYDATLPKHSVVSRTIGTTQLERTSFITFTLSTKPCIII